MGIKNPNYGTPRYSVDKTTAQKGERHWKSKLTDDDVRMILQLVQEGLSQSEVARKFEVPRQTVHSIVRGKTWRHIV